MNKLKSAFTSITTKLQQSQQSQDAQGHDSVAPDPDASIAFHGRLAWPPKLVCPPRVLGEVKDVSGRPYKRDIGRSIHIGGHTYYMFGDTFCFDSSGDFCGVTNNTIALIPSLSKPTRSQWLTPHAHVPEFVPFTDEERDFNNQHKGENKRYVNWVFGGVIDRPGSHGREGWLFYDSVEIDGAEAVKQRGVGAAKVRVTDFRSGSIECERVGPFPLFDPEGPLWGNISNIAAPDGWTYLLSGKGLDNYMARIRTKADFAHAENYQFLKKGGGWASSYDPKGPFGPFGELAHDVLQGQGQGAIVHIPNHGPKGKPYVWFGCEKFLTSQLWVGAAERPQGPWELYKIGEMPKIDGEQSKTRYCIYPHLWGSIPGKGEILISWSDDGTMGGKVAAGVFSFAIM